MKTAKVALLLLVPLLAATAFAVAASGVLPYRVYVVHTGSMTPTIPTRSAVFVRDDVYHVGQVVTFTEHGMTVTHRLIAIGADGRITTKGDANPTADPWHVPKSQIIGGVVAAPRQVGYWLEYLKNPAGLASVLLACLVCWQIWSLAGGGSTAPARRVRRVPRHRIQRSRHRTRTPRHRIGTHGGADLAPDPVPTST